MAQRGGSNGGSGKVVLGLAIGTAYTRAATASVNLGDDGSIDASLDGISGGGGGGGLNNHTSAALARPETVVNADGARGTPTVVARRRPEEGMEGEEEWLVGDAAKAAMAGRGGNVEAWDGPRILRALRGGGGKDDDEEEEEEDDEEGVEEAVGQLLGHVLEQAENFSGESPSDCVLAVPSGCSEEQRRAAIHACNMAGLSVLGVIREPMAALLAYQQEQQQQQAQQQENGKKKIMVVFDLGHVHLDVGVVEEDAQGLLRLLHSSTTPSLGGQELVEKLVGLCLVEFRRKAGCDARESRRAMAKLRRECEAALRTLSTSQQADVEIDALYEGCDLRTRITRARFEGECLDLLKGCLAAVEQALQGAGLTKEDVDLLLLTGAASRVPKLQAWLQATFPEGTCKVKMAPVDVNPEEGAAIGAAIQAQLLVAASAAAAALSSSSTTDAHPVTSPLALSPLGFGVLVTRIPTPEDASSAGGGGIAQSLIDSFRRYATIGGSAPAGAEGAPKPFVLIGEGEPLPAQRSVRIAAAEKGQADLHIQLIAVAGEGEAAVVHTVGALAVATPSGAEGEEELELTLRLNADGALNVVVASCKDGNVLKEATVRPAASE